MATRTIELGDEKTLKVLFSYPNIPDSTEPLDQTLLHWIGATLERDGFSKDNASISVKGDCYSLVLERLPDTQTDLYAARFPAILAIGWAAWSGPVQEILARKIWCTDNQIRPMWDPLATDQWRFFLTLGVGIVSHRTLQFFHYPPQRLLNPLRDSMEDPVTYRCRDLLVANGVDANDTKYYETRINSTPIAAPDDQGTNFSPAANPIWGGLIPIGYFRKFESDMISTLLKPHDSVAGYTIPMTAYGKDPRQRFGGMFLNPDIAMVLEILPGHKTPVLGSNHPYRFYYEAQQAHGGKVGSGKLNPKSVKICTELQQEDLAVVRWQVEMAKDPSQDPWQVIQTAKAHWKAAEQQTLVCALVRRHGSLTYADPQGFKFSFAISLDDALKTCKENANNPLGGHA